MHATRDNYYHDHQVDSKQTTSHFSFHPIMTRGLQRAKEPQDLSSHQFGSTMRGRVTAVNDGDGFRFYHTPGGRLAGWGWLRKVPTARSDLKGQTLPIRIAGIDAPERLHFGRPAQPYSDDAMYFLQLILLEKNVKIVPYLVDQYRRVVARVTVRTVFGRKDVGELMLKKGMAVVYEAKTGAQYGDREQVYRRLQDQARNHRVGLWQSEQVLTPMEYKRHYRNQGPTTLTAKPKPAKPKPAKPKPTKAKPTKGKPTKAKSKPPAAKTQGKRKPAPANLGTKPHSLHLRPRIVIAL